MMDIANNWNARDTSLLAAALAATYADSRSTKGLIGRGGRETNPLLSTSPSGAELDKAALIAAGAGTGISTMLPPSVRRPALGAWAGLESGLAYKNARANPNAKPTDLAHSSLEGPLMMAGLGAGLGYLLDKSDVQPSVESSIVKTADGRSVPEYRVGFSKNFAAGGPVLNPRGFARATTIDRRNLTYKQPKGFARLKQRVMR